ncbi:DnaB-like helicase N-terminal domain-containing protein, partial [Acinetobacter baumannii]
MSQANATSLTLSSPTENKTSESGQLKEFRTPPHNLAIEQAVLAALMTVAESFEQVSDLLKENDFYATRHKYIYRAIEKLAQENSPYDAVLVNDWLLKQNLLDAIGGEEYLMQLMADSPSSFYNLETYATKIKEFSTLRSMIKVSTEILQNAYDTKGRGVSEI